MESFIKVLLPNLQIKYLKAPIDRALVQEQRFQRFVFVINNSRADFLQNELSFFETVAKLVSSGKLGQT